MRKSYWKAVREHRAYDYIANNYWDMSKSELKECCLEALYQLSERQDDMMADEIKKGYPIEEEW